MDRDILDKKLGGGNREREAEGERKERQRESEEKGRRKKEERAGELFVLGDHLPTLPPSRKFGFFFFCEQRSKKTVCYFIITHLIYSLYRQFRKGIPPKKKRPNHFLYCY